MPRSLPQPYLTHVTAPGEMGIPHARPRQSDAATWRAVGQLAERVEMAEDEIQRSRQIADLNNAKATLFQRLVDFETGLDTRNDFDAFESDFRNLVQDLKGEFSQSLDGTTLNAFKPHFTQQATRFRLKVRDRARRRKVDSIRASSEGNLRGYTNALEHSDASIRADALNLIELQLAQDVQAGARTQEEAQELWAKAETHHNVSNARIFANVTAQADGYEAAINWLKSQEEIPLSEKTRKVLIHDLEHEANIKNAKAKAKLEAAREQWREKVMLPKYRTGTLIWADIEGSPLRASEKKTLWNQTRARVKELATGKSKFTKEQKKLAEAEAFKAIRSGKITTQAQLDMGYLEKLDPDRHEWLSNRLQEITKEKDKPFEKRKKQAEDLIEGSIIDKSIFARHSPEDEARAYEAIVDFYQELEKGEAQGKDKMDMLTPGHKDYVLDKIVTRNAATPMERLKERTSALTRTRKPQGYLTTPETIKEQGAIKGKKIPGPLPPKKKGETPEEYFKRIGME